MKNTVVIGSDHFETDQQREDNLRRGVPSYGVGDGSIIEGAILDKDCRIGANVRITNQEKIKEEEGRNYVIREGIVVIPRGAIVPDGTVI